ncbi:site-specific integrase [Staphylococcus xylosus]|uniref:tyrosine-type recombinase/integrase n=1 Tax=Staphylococcus xylosus TaxID=1288 RepID=UPI002DB932B9|nr:site-specific integrase [Staphylococcus xylosus]MEB7800357.1 site-specific integrase [Staphylococcus xylosus]
MYIQQLENGSYKVTIEAPRDPKTGKRRQITRRHQSKSESIKRAEQEYQRLFKSNNTYDVKSEHTFRNVSLEWLSFYSNVRSKRSVESRKSLLRLIYQYFDSVLIQKITHNDIQNMMNQFRSVEKYSVYYLNSIKGCINLIMNFALENKYIQVNPCANVKYHYNQSKRDAITVYERNELNENIISLNELNAIINKLQSDYRITNSYNLVLIMMLNTGCRLNEALALKHSDFSIDDKTLEINKYLHIKNTRNYYSVEKLTEECQRKVKLNCKTIELIQKLINRNLEMRNLYIEIYVQDDFLFCDKLGHPYFINHLKSEFKQAHKDLNLELAGKTVNSIRLLFLKHLIDADLSFKRINYLMGHKSISTTKILIEKLRNL